MSNKTTSQLGLAELATGNDQVGIMSLRKESTRSLPAVNLARVLVAEDDDEMRAVIALHLRREGYEVTECRNGMELLDQLKGYVEQIGGAEQFELIISDVRMPGVFGMTVAEGATDYEDFPPMILITAFGDAQTHQTAEKYGVKAVLDKPFKIPVLLDIVRQLIVG